MLACQFEQKTKSPLAAGDSLAITGFRSVLVTIRASSGPTLIDILPGFTSWVRQKPDVGRNPGVYPNAEGYPFIESGSVP